ncbi:nucleotidyl transferase AbiEii/AbiGii toxin family protein [Nocardia sp. NPDC050710]|uniref:nucleotidyl transferase AbiEii/AbiGii toxin family protein n=1 Tax=Nocardia sp. NPDC050710 TaxID=3157220 RepID=UPI0033D38B7C
MRFEHQFPESPCAYSAAHLAALDHTLALIAGSEWGDGLVLRGSMTMRAWIGEQARPPGDLDWIMPTGTAFPDPLAPFPYLDDIARAQQWPEALDGAARYRMWTEEEFDTFGSRPKLPPEGLRWLQAEEYEPFSLLDQVADIIRDNPNAPGGVVLDADDISQDENWIYAHLDEDTGRRLLVPWDYGTESGAIQLDFAIGEWLPETPVWTAVPRSDGGPPTPVVTASRELSLAWKVLWLDTDSTDERMAAGKDLYDAVLLAESPQTRMTPGLLRKVLGNRFPRVNADRIQGWSVDWSGFRRTHPGVHGEVDGWLERLARALPCAAIS